MEMSLARSIESHVSPVKSQLKQTQRTIGKRTVLNIPPKVAFSCAVRCSIAWNIGVRVILRRFVDECRAEHRAVLRLVLHDAVPVVKAGVPLHLVEATVRNAPLKVGRGNSQMTTAGRSARK